MKYIKLFETRQTEEEIAYICNKYRIENWKLNEQGLVDVDGDVHLVLSGSRLNYILLKFGLVTGNFDCSYGYKKSLDGAPHTVLGDFRCCECGLTTLEGGPEYVGKDYSCHSNRLTSLKGVAKHIIGMLYCYNNKITTLQWGPESVELVSIFNNPISGIPKEYLNDEYLDYIIKEISDWNIYRKDGSLRLDRLEEMIEWGIQEKKIKRLKRKRRGS
jgi:hypothetical protein